MLRHMAYLLVSLHRRLGTLYKGVSPAHVLVLRATPGVTRNVERERDAREAAAESAGHVPGIVGVANDLEVMPSV
jgi:hypothetical protein